MCERHAVCAAAAAPGSTSVPPPPPPAEPRRRRWKAKNGFSHGQDGTGTSVPTRILAAAHLSRLRRPCAAQTTKPSVPAVHFTRRCAHLRPGRAVSTQPTPSSPIFRPAPPAPQRPGGGTLLEAREEASEYRFGGVLQRRAPGTALWAAFGPSSGEQQHGALCGVCSGTPRLEGRSECMYRCSAAFALSHFAAATAARRAVWSAVHAAMGQLGACALSCRLSRTPTQLTRMQKCNDAPAGRHRFTRSAQPPPASQQQAAPGRAAGATWRQGARAKENERVRKGKHSS